jgi:hypothetical protein
VIRIFFKGKYDIDEEFINVLELEIKRLKRLVKKEEEEESRYNLNGINLKDYQLNNIKLLFKSYESESNIITSFINNYEKTFQITLLIKLIFQNSKLIKKENIIIFVEDDDKLKEWRLTCIKWLIDYNVFDLTKIKGNNKRLNVFNNWEKSGGLLLISYKVFKKLSTIINNHSGIDLIIFDEFDLNYLKLMKRLNYTKCRIVLSDSKLELNSLIIKENVFVKISFQEILNSLFYYSTQIEK